MTEKRSDTSIADIDESSADLRFLEQKSSVRLVLFDRSIDKNRDGRPPYSRRFKSALSSHIAHFFGVFGGPRPAEQQRTT